MFKCWRSLVKFFFTDFEKEKCHDFVTKANIPEDSDWKQLHSICLKFAGSRLDLRVIL